MSRFPRIIAFALLVSLALAVSVLFDLLPILRGDEILNWQWGYNAPTVRAIPLIIATVIYIIIAWRLFRYRPRWLLLWSIIGTVVFSFAVIYVRFDDVLYEQWLRTVSGLTTGQHLAGAVIDWGSERTLTQWADVMWDFDTLSGHIALSPPGLPMFYGGLNAILDNIPALTQPVYATLLPYQCHNYLMLDYTPAEWTSSIFGVLMPLWSALAVFPLYACAKRLTGHYAKWVIIWWAIVPSLLIFTPNWNSLYPLLALLAFWFYLVGLESKRFKAIGSWILSGFFVSLLTFANVSLAPLPAIFGFYTLLHYFRNERQQRPFYRPIMIGLWFGIGTILVWVIYYFVGGGTTPLDILDVAMGRHLGQERRYLPWVIFHFWEWAFFTGIPLIIIWMWTAVKQFVGLRQTGSVTALSVLLTLLILIISGTARGETGRVWIFSSPFVLIGVVEFFKHIDLQSHRPGWLITWTQAIFMLAVCITIPAVDVLDFTNPPDAPEVITNTRPIDVRFGEELRLVGWNGEIVDNDLLLTLTWQTQIQILRPYWFAALLVDPDGNPSGEAIVWQPFETRYPTTCWQPNTFLSDQIRLPLPDAPIEGDWWVSLVILPDDENPENRLTVTLADGSEDNQLGLGPTTVNQGSN